MYKYHNSWLHAEPYVLPGAYVQQHDFASHKFLALHAHSIATMSFGSIAVNAFLAKVIMYSSVHYMLNTKLMCQGL